MTIISIKKYKIGLVIGRFQPFHYGHAYLLHKALGVADKIIVGIGSSNVTNSDNPWSYQKRRKMLELFIQKEVLQSRIIKIVPLPDHPDDNVWLKETLKKCGSIGVVIGNNDWVEGIFKGANLPVVRINHYKRILFEGYKIRKLMMQGKKWENRVPKILRPLLLKSA